MVPFEAAVMDSVHSTMPVSATACCGGSQCDSRSVTSCACAARAVARMAVVASSSLFIFSPPIVGLSRLQIQVDTYPLSGIRKRPLQSVCESIGGPAAGAKAVSRLNRMCPDGQPVTSDPYALSRHVCRSLRGEIDKGRGHILGATYAQVLPQLLRQRLATGHHFGKWLQG